MRPPRDWLQQEAQEGDVTGAHDEGLEGGEYPSLSLCPISSFPFRSPARTWLTLPEKFGRTASRACSTGQCWDGGFAQPAHQPVFTEHLLWAWLCQIPLSSAQGGSGWKSGEGPGGQTLAGLLKDRGAGAYVLSWGRRV